MRQSADPAPSAPLPSPKERRRLREAKSLSREQVASALGVTSGTVKSWESGRASPKGPKRRAYAELLAAPTPAAPAKAPEPEPAAELASKPAPDPEPAPHPAPPLTPAQAFDALYAHAAPAMQCQAYLLTGRRRISREAVVYAFHLAWQRWPEVATDRDPVGWIRAAAYEYAMSPWHRLRRVRRRPDRPPAQPDRRALLDALLALPPIHRRTLLLYDGLGLDLPDTAAETEASTPAAASRLLNARALLAQRLPELAEVTPADQSAVLHARLAELAEAAPGTALPAARAVRTGSERRTRFWTRTAIVFTALIVSATTFTVVTAPTRYIPPIAPAEAVAGVPVLGGPPALTPQDEELRDMLYAQPMNGPGRLLPVAR